MCREAHDGLTAAARPRRLDCGRGRCAPCAGRSARRSSTGLGRFSSSKPGRAVSSTAPAPIDGDQAPGEIRPALMSGRPPFAGRRRVLDANADSLATPWDSGADAKTQLTGRGPVRWGGATTPRASQFGRRSRSGRGGAVNRPRRAGRRAHTSLLKLRLPLMRVAPEAARSASGRLFRSRRANPGVCRAGEGEPTPW